VAGLIPVSEWAVEVFGDHKPHRVTLARWIDHGLIRPMPKKIGRAYFCSPNAENVDLRAEKMDLIERISGGSPKKNRVPA
jgi:predicted site-specific integrase-resolvase